LFNPKGRLEGLRHFIQFYIHGNNGIQIEDERIENSKPSRPNTKDVFFFYRYNQGAPVISVVSEEGAQGRGERNLVREKLELNQSILSQKKDNSFYPEITTLGETYSQLFVNREWQMGRRSEMRMPQPADGETRALSPDGRNLGLILNKQRQNTAFKKQLMETFRVFYPGFYDIESSIEAGMVRIKLQEEVLNDGLPASRLSDGTIRFLFLLVVLLNPEPAPLICLEEPEIGLHPDILPTVAKLLVEASEKTQLIVTTHSDILLDALTDTPESVLFCDKENGETQMRRASAADIQHYLGQKGLGQTWLDGSLGGKRF
jgi:predicted ATPase